MSGRFPFAHPMVGPNKKTADLPKKEVSRRENVACTVDDDRGNRRSSAGGLR